MVERCRQDLEATQKLAVAVRPHSEEGSRATRLPPPSAAVRQNTRRPCSRRGVPLACASARAARTRPGDVDDHTNVVPAGLGKRGALLEGGGRRPFLCGHEAASRAAHLPPPLSAGPLERPIERCWREARSGRPEAWIGRLLPAGRVRCGTRRAERSDGGTERWLSGVD